MVHKQRGDSMKNEVSVQEKELGAEVSHIERKAQEMVIRTNEDFKEAGNAVKVVKSVQKRVEEYWEPMRKTTYDAYKSVTDHKKAMVDPLKRAEATIKGKMSDYQMAQEKIRREQEEKMRALARAEMEKKMAEADEAEKSGDVFSAEYARVEAEALEAASSTMSVQKAQIKVDGVAQKKAWEITGIDLAELPCEFCGVVIRPADEAAIMRLIKASKGGIRIPGVEFRETVSFAVKA